MPRLARADPAVPPRQGLRTLQLRILSSLVLAPIAIGAVWFGWPWLPLLTAAAGAVMAWEWARLCRTERSGTVALAAMRRRILALQPSGLVLVVAVLAAVVAAAVAATGIGIGLSVAGAAARFHDRRAGASCAARLGSRRARCGSRCPASCCCGWRVATDPGAPLCCGSSQSSGQPISAPMRFGSQLGGPRLAPRWSPRKTWAGLARRHLLRRACRLGHRAAARRIARFYRW